jgi:hypothetical protein
MANFEYDPEKSAANAAKHGVDFEAAQALWLDPNRIEIPARTTPEPRTLVIALWSSHSGAGSTGAPWSRLARPTCASSRCAEPAKRR